MENETTAKNQNSPICATYHHPSWHPSETSATENFSPEMQKEPNSNQKWTAEAPLSDRENATRVQAHSVDDQGRSSVFFFFLLLRQVLSHRVMIYELDWINNALIMLVHIPSTIWLPVFICLVLQVEAAHRMILIEKCDSYLDGCREHLKYKIHLVPISLRTLFM